MHWCHSSLIMIFNDWSHRMPNITLMYKNVQFFKVLLITKRVHLNSYPHLCKYWRCFDFDSCAVCCCCWSAKRLVTWKCRVKHFRHGDPNDPRWTPMTLDDQKGPWWPLSPCVSNDPWWEMTPECSYYTWMRQIFTKTFMAWLLAFVCESLSFIILIIFIFSW